MGALKFGVIGMGRHGSRYIRHIIEDIEDADLVAVCRKGPQEDLSFFERYPDVGFFNDHRKLLKEDIEAVVIATPTSLHEKMASDALSAGVNVILEKPMAQNVEACRRLIEVEKGTDGKLMIAQTLRYSPVWMKMKELMVDAPFPEWFEMVQYLEPPEPGWLLDPDLAGGGCLLNTGVHVFDSLCFIFGARIKKVECRTERNLNPTFEDFAYGTVKLEGGLEGSFKIARDSRYRSRTLRIDHEGGVLYGDSIDNRLMKLADGIETNIGLRGETRTLIPLIEDFVRCIRKGSEMPITSQDGVNAVQAAEACYRSAELGSEISI